MVVEPSDAMWSDWDAGWWVRGRGCEDGLVSAEEALACAVGRRLTDDEAALARTLDQLYSSEINVRVTRTAAGWIGYVGDERNSFAATNAAVPARVLLDWLTSAACRAFPGSEYARRFASR